MTAAAIPATLVTGFLGAGKTTLLNRLGATGGLTDALVVINEFGQVGLDHMLMIARNRRYLVDRAAAMLSTGNRSGNRRPLATSPEWFHSPGSNGGIRS